MGMVRMGSYARTYVRARRSLIAPTVLMRKALVRIAFQHVLALLPPPPRRAALPRPAHARLGACGGFGGGGFGRAGGDTCPVLLTRQHPTGDNRNDTPRA